MSHFQEIDTKEHPRDVPFDYLVSRPELHGKLLDWHKRLVKRWEPKFGIVNRPFRDHRMDNF